MAGIYPQGTSDLYKFLGVHNPESEQATEQSDASSGVQLPAAQPAVQPQEASPAATVDKPLISKDKAAHVITVNISKINFGKILKEAFPYVAIFVICLVTYFAFFMNVSISSLIKQFFNKPQTAAQTTVVPSIPSDQIQAYNAWIDSYFYDVSDQSIIDPSNDISGNGLTNYQKFLLGLNPKKKDTIGLGMTDTEALLKGIDPLSGGPITDKEKQIIAQSIDLEAISNKLSLAAASSTPKVGGQTTNSGDRQSVEINQSINAEVDIPALNVTVPLIWTQDVNNFNADLPNGLVHYPGTAMPGEVGTSYISGHSSNYVWIKGKYNNVFAHLDRLKKYDSFTISATDQRGRQVIFHYAVTASGIFKADDQRQFADIGKSTVALSTCWPVGTSAERHVVFAQMTQIDMPGN